MERVNGAHSHAEGIRRWCLPPHDLSAIAEFPDLVDEMYAEAEGGSR